MYPVTITERTALGPSGNSPTLFHPDVTAEEIIDFYSTVGAFLREFKKRGKTSWDCSFKDTDEKFTLTKAGLDAFMAKAVALHRCAE
jgi:hypothetical protein